MLCHASSEMEERWFAEIPMTSAESFYRISVSNTNGHNQLANYSSIDTKHWWWESLYGVSGENRHSYEIIGLRAEQGPAL